MVALIALAAFAQDPTPTLSQELEQLSGARTQLAGHSSSTETGRSVDLNG